MVSVLIPCSKCRGTVEQPIDNFFNVAGSDVSGIRTTATLSDDGRFYIVNGSKKWITNGLWSDYMLTAVRTGEPGGKNALSALIVPLSAEGVTCRRLHNSGVSASGSTYIELDEVRVPVENLLGGPEGLGKGFKMIVSSKSGFWCLREVSAATLTRLSRLQPRAIYHCDAILEDVPPLL